MILLSVFAHFPLTSCSSLAQLVITPMPKDKVKSSKVKKTHTKVLIFDLPCSRVLAHFDLTCSRVVRVWARMMRNNHRCVAFR
jgi:hypothetical protein